MNTRRFLKALAVAFISLAFLVGCTEQRNKAQNIERNTARNQLSGFLEGQPVPAFKYSQLRQNLIEIQTAQANGIATTSFFFHTGSADPVKQCPSVGYAIPATYQLTNPQQKLRDSEAVVAQIESTGVYTADTTGTYVICVDGNGKARATYWEGFVLTESGPATWDRTTKQIVPTGEPSGTFTAKK